jgi:UDP-N-acetyl-D-galactosamine dehydrogenase
VVVIDPWANTDEVQHEYGIELGVISEQSPVDSLIVAVGHQEFRELSPQQLRKFCRTEQPVLADIKALYTREACDKAGFTLFRF